MPSTNDPNIFRNKWHSYIETTEDLKNTLHPDQWNELDETLDELHDLINDAANELEGKN